MRSNTERATSILSPRLVAGGLAGVFAAVIFLSTAASAQTVDVPNLSVFRKGVGVVSRMGEKQTVVPGGESAHDLVIGDFDADGILDAGTFDAAARLFTIRRSGDGSTLVLSAPSVKGRPIVAAADYDGDGRTDPALWRGGTWQILLSSRDYALDIVVFGIAGDVPVPADFDGDSRSDAAVFRASENRWYIQSSETGKVSTYELGIAGADLLLPADYTGDGKADVAVYRAGVWHMIDSETGVLEQFEFGFDDALPVPGDHNRDGRMDFAVFQKGTWYVYDGSGLISYRFGDNDLPLGIVPVRNSVPVR